LGIGLKAYHDRPSCFQPQDGCPLTGTIRPGHFGWITENIQTLSQFFRHQPCWKTIATDESAARFYEAASVTASNQRLYWSVPDGQGIDSLNPVRVNSKTNVNHAAFIEQMAPEGLHHALMPSAPKKTHLVIDSGNAIAGHCSEANRFAQAVQKPFSLSVAAGSTKGQSHRLHR